MKVSHLLTFLLADEAKGIVRIVLFSGLLLTASISPFTLTAQGDNGQSKWRGSGLRAAVLRESADVGPEAALRAFPVEFWKFADSSVVTELIDALQNGSLEVRKAAALALGQVEGTDMERIVTELATALTDHDDDVRKASARVLESFDPERIVPALIDTLGDGNSHAQQAAAARALGEIESTDPERIVTALIDALGNGTSQVRQAAAEALGPIESADPERVVTALIEVLGDGDGDVRQAAARALGQIKGADPERVATALIEVLGDGDGDVRKAAVRALGPINSTDPERIVTALIKVLEDGDGDVWKAVTRALGRIKGADPERIVTELIDALANGRSQVRQAAAEALGRINGTDPERVVTALIKVLEDGDGDVRKAAVRTLGPIESADPERVVTALIEVLEGGDSDVRQAVARALGQIKGADPERIVTVLAKILENDDVDVRKAAAKALGEVEGAPPKRVMTALIDAIRSGSWPVLRAVVQAIRKIESDDPDGVVAEITTELENDDVDVRRAVARVLGRIKGADPEGVVTALVTAIEDSDVVVRQAAARALGQIKGADPEQVMTALTTALMDDNADVRQEAVQALGQIEGTDLEGVVTALTTTLSDKNADVRFAAALALGQVKATDLERSVSELTTALSDDNPGVRLAAALALGQFELLYWEQIFPAIIALPTNSNDELHLARVEFIREYVDDLGTSDVNTSLVLLNQVHSNSFLKPVFRLWARFLAGDDEDGQILVDWFGGATNKPIDGLDYDHTRAESLIKLFSDNLLTTKDLKDVRLEIADSIHSIVSKSENGWEPKHNRLLREVRSNLSDSGFTAQAAYIDNIISDLNPNSIEKGALLVLSGHATLWVLLIFVYPYSRTVQAFFFWNKWVRWFVGFGYVPILLAWVPFLRRRLFLPFRTSLLADAQLDSFDSDLYFDGSLATFSVDGEQIKLVDAIPEICGQIVLEGESGLGKTMFIRKLLSDYRRIVVYLPATKCVDGVMAAIQSKVQGPIRDLEFLQSLVFAGAIDVIIDGLNEVSPTTHARIVEFADIHFSGNILISTQPMEWTPPPNFQTLEMKPLTNTQVLEFILTRTKSMPEDASVSGTDYVNFCRQYIEQALMDTEPDSGEAVQSALSNPMDLTVIADILSRGGRPDLLDLRRQQYAVMAADYERRQNGRSFPLERFSERTYELRKSDRDHFDVDEFPDELARMEKHRMIVTRPAHDQDGSPVSQFRHDKIMDFFLYQAFTGENKTRQLEHLRDARFRGIYLLLATHLPYHKAMKLREILIKQAAKTKDHSLSDQFVQLLEQRPPEK